MTIARDSRALLLGDVGHVQTALVVYTTTLAMGTKVMKDTKVVNFSFMH